MPQNPLLTVVAAQYKKLTAAGVIKAVPGTLVTVIVDVAASGGSLTLNDCATVGAAGSGNQIASIAASEILVGVPYTFLWPCKAGIVVSAVPTGGTVRVSYA